MARLEYRYLYVLIHISIYQYILRGDTLTVRKSITISDELASRMTKYETDFPEAWNNINWSAICAKAIDEELSKRESENKKIVIRILEKQKSYIVYSGSQVVGTGIYDSFEKSVNMDRDYTPGTVTIIKDGRNIAKYIDVMKVEISKDLPSSWTSAAAGLQGP